MARRDDAPRDLLLGLLALQNGMVTRDQLIAAFAVWNAAGDRALADLLAEQGKFGSIRTLGGHRRYNEAEIHAFLAGAKEGGFDTGVSDTACLRCSRPSWPDGWPMAPRTNCWRISPGAWSSATAW